jgi:hypothetical protein
MKPGRRLLLKRFLFKRHCAPRINHAVKLLMQCPPFYLTCVAFIFFSGPLHCEKIKIKGINIEYSENHQTMTASGNAELIHPNFTVFADRITYNKDTQIITGINNVEMSKDNQIIISDTFHYNTSTNIMKIQNLRLELTAKKNHHVVITAQDFNDMGSLKTGKNGKISTCGYTPPHYHFEAETFKIIPEKRIIGQNVQLVNPVFFLPLGFWSPTYIFELGKRKVIYLMPVIGTNKVEGSFFKNQFDYVVNDTWTGEAYIDSLSAMGIGLGSRLNYNNYSTLDGYFYYYTIVDTPYNTKKWAQTWKLSPENELKTHILNKNMILINGNHTKTDEHQVKFKKTTIEGRQTASYSFDQSNISNSNPKNIKLNYNSVSDANNQLDVSIHHSKNRTQRDDISLRTQQKIGYDILNRNKLSYNQREWSSTDKRIESSLATNTQFSKTFGFGRITNTIDMRFDTDGDTVTEDVKNHTIQKLPELNLYLNPVIINPEVSIFQTFNYGNYKENYYISSLDKVRNYENSKFHMEQKISGAWGPNYFKRTLNTLYNQYYYSSNDQAYTLETSASVETDSLSFLKTNTGYKRRFSPKKNNTPFYFDQYEQREKNELTEQLTVYWLSPEKFSLQYSSGYNWIINQQLDNNYKVSIRPNQTNSFIFKTTFRIRTKQYTPLSSKWELTPNRLFSSTIQANYDLNLGEMIDLNHKLSGATSRQWENRWIFDAYFTYSPKFKQNYQLQSLSLTKDLHERKLTFIYNRVLEEYRFQFTINAFPENNIGIKSNQYESFRLEGVFDDESVQR